SAIVTLMPRGSAKQPRVKTLGNAASLEGTVVSPGEIVSILGTGIGPEEPAARHLDPLNPLKEAETTLSDTRVLFDGVAAPLTFVQATKVNAVVPPTVVGKETTQVEIEYQGQ